ncbi:MAG TPA: lipocalin-like domain-containing protein [Candidatus Angelobacter sp.]|nr:lipocalin-like domain-containing protein [Candidatus Angelobacter sp.]
MSSQTAELILSAISLPRDQYRHAGAPTEWWWHVGTLKAANGRTFGFEINATGELSFGFTQIEITDVANQVNYQQVTPIVPLPSNWAEDDPSKPWRVNLGPLGGPGGNVSMSAIGGNPLDMKVEAEFVDTASSKHCKLALGLFQEGAPLLVWGTGHEEVDPKGKTPITQNNYYYSLTHLRASGVLQIGAEKFEVKGLTWIDHEYGAFPKDSPGKPVVWTLQDMQLSNGVHLSNFTEFGIAPKAGIPMKSHATVLRNGKSTFVKSVTTPLAPTFTSAKGVVYYLKYNVEINDPLLQATFTVTSLFPNQVFRSPGNEQDVYEGVAKCEGTFGDIKEPVTGTAWIEQNLK